MNDSRQAHLITINKIIITNLMSYREGSAPPTPPICRPPASSLPTPPLGLESAFPIDIGLELALQA